MPKQTRKYVAAVELANQLAIDIPESQSTLYVLLMERNYYWNSGTQTWELAALADPPTGAIKIRVWAEDSKVRGAADQIKVAMTEIGYQFLEESEVYPCRPPKQLESRIYLSFK